MKLNYQKKMMKRVVLEMKKNKQMEMYRQFDPKNKEDCDISLFTGCTACVTIIDGDKIYCSNAGDSRAVLCKKRSCLSTIN